MKDRAFLKNATMLSLRRDERNQRLMVRFCAVNHKDFSVRRNTFGDAKKFGSGATQITTATQMLISKFCTVGDGLLPPVHNGKPHRQQPSLDTDLEQHCRTIQKQLVIDAAADERLSARQMVEGCNHDGIDALTPNQTVTLDKAHASRRILSRTFNNDDLMKKVLDKYILGKKSICTIIHNSKHLSDQFDSFVKSLNPSEYVGGRTSNLGVATHRFDSISKRLGRFVGKFYAVALFADWLRVNRVGTVEAKIGTAFLAEVTEEEFILLAMMGDASDEAYMLTLYADDEEMDITAETAELAVFMNNIEYLFLDRGCVVAHGYTAWAIGVCKTPKMLNAGNLGLRTFGDPNLSASVVNNCLARMKGWYHLAKHVIHADFPEFETTQAFSVFNLAKPRKYLRSQCTTDETDAIERQGIRRVALLLELPEAELDQQFKHVQPFARKQFIETGCDTFTAWANAVKLVESMRGSSSCREMIRIAVAGLALYGGSSSGVEQTFSKLYRQINPQQLGCGSDRESQLSKVLMDHDEAEEDEVITNARLVWSTYFGQPRKCHKKKTKGVKAMKSSASGQCENAGTEIGWLRTRRQSVLDAASKSKRIDLTHDDDDDLVWTAKHTKEAAFQDAKRLKRKCNAYHDSLLLPEDQDATFLAQAAEHHAKRAKTDAARIRKEARLHNFNQCPAPMCWLRKCVYVDKDVQTIQLNETLLQKGAVIQDHRHTAEVFIVSDPAEPGNRVLWCACLLGGCIATPDYVIHGHGAAVWYSTGLKRNVKLSISTKWAEKHQTIAKLIQVCKATSKKSKCQLISETDFDNLIKKGRCQEAGMHSYGFRDNGRNKAQSKIVN